MAKAFDDAVKPGRVSFAQPSNGACEITDGCRCRECKSGKWVLTGRGEFTNGHKRLCIEDATEWVNA